MIYIDHFFSIRNGTAANKIINQIYEKVSEGVRSDTNRAIHMETYMLANGSFI